MSANKQQRFCYIFLHSVEDVFFWKLIVSMQNTPVTYIVVHLSNKNYLKNAYGFIKTISNLNFCFS